MGPKPELSIVCTIYRGEGMVAELVRQVSLECDSARIDYEIILVEDRSPDSSWDEILEICGENPRIRALRMARNVGQQIAVSAGLRYASAPFVIAMDGDLQNPPDAIPLILGRLKEGFDVVYTVSTARNTAIDAATSQCFWWLMNTVLQVGIVPNQLMMRGFSARALRTFNSYDEHVRNVVGITHDIGLNTTVLEVENRKRHAGRSNYGFFKRFDVLLDVVLASSNRPLTYLIYFSFAAMAFGLGLGIMTVINHLRYPEMPPGYASLATLLICFGSATLAVLGIIGRYLANIYTEVRRRPLFSVDKEINFQANQ